ncbi:hypothetical protein V7122_23355, partial [Bacillus sp. JJ1532]|uniref:hypothetical protein n=1 Tax=Bacillus sp. JJ1532 TaxID=3122958 RepID=UPI002FFE2636
PRRTGRTSVDNATGQGKPRQRNIARPKVKLLGGRRVFGDLEVISQSAKKVKEQPSRQHVFCSSGVGKALTLFYLGGEDNRIK